MAIGYKKTATNRTIKKKTTTTGTTKPVTRDEFMGNGRMMKQSTPITGGKRKITRLPYTGDKRSLTKLPYTGDKRSLTKLKKK